MSSQSTSVVCDRGQSLVDIDCGQQLVYMHTIHSVDHITSQHEQFMPEQCCCANIAALITL